MRTIYPTTLLSDTELESDSISFFLPPINSPTKREILLKQKLMSISHLAVDVLGYTQFTPLHIGWFAEILDSNRVIFLAPRGHFKTTCFSIVYPIYKILSQPSIRILLINEILDNAKGFLREIKFHLQSPRFVEEFGRLNADAGRWTENAISLQNSRVSKDPTIGVAGTLGAIVSRHCDLIIVDDSISARNSQTPAQRRKILRWFLETLMPILEPDGQILVIGTRFHNDDMYGEMLKENKFLGWKKIVLKAEYRSDSGEKMILFPERFSCDTLAQLRADMGEAYYNSQYCNDPSKLEGQNFKFDWLEFYETEPKILHVFQGVDLAISKKDSAAHFALVTIGIPPEGDIYLLDYTYDHLDFPQQCQVIKSAQRQHKPIMMGIEANSYQEALPQFLRADPEAKRLPFKAIQSYGEKILRLTSLAPLFERGVIKVRSSMHDFIDEYLAFPQSGTFDLLDALFFAIEVSKEQEIEPQILEIEL